jgi:hypothetical protein
MLDLTRPLCGLRTQISRMAGVAESYGRMTPWPRVHCHKRLVCRQESLFKLELWLSACDLLNECAKSLVCC